jgi:hypothetical protein
VVTSCYFQATRRRKLFKGTISEFVRDPHYGIRKVVTYFNIWHENRDVPKAFQVFRYEDLHAEPRKSLRTALEFMGVTDLDEEIVRNAVDFSRFDNMKRMERERRFENARLQVRDEADPESNKVRKGKVGGHADYLSPEDLAHCNDVIAELGCPLANAPG